MPSKDKNTIKTGPRRQLDVMDQIADVLRAMNLNKNKNKNNNKQVSKTDSDEESDSMQVQNPYQDQKLELNSYPRGYWWVFFLFSQDSPWGARWWTWFQGKWWSIWFNPSADIPGQSKSSSSTTTARTTEDQDIQWFAFIDNY